jgi:hypothetical protein
LPYFPKSLEVVEFSECYVSSDFYVVINNSVLLQNDILSMIQSEFYNVLPNLREIDVTSHVISGHNDDDDDVDIIGSDYDDDDEEVAMVICIVLMVMRCAGVLMEFLGRKLSHGSETFSLRP